MDPSTRIYIFKENNNSTTCARSSVERSHSTDSSLSHHYPKSPSDGFIPIITQSPKGSAISSLRKPDREPELEDPPSDIDDMPACSLQLASVKTLSPSPPPPPPPRVTTPATTTATTTATDDNCSSFKSIDDLSTSSSRFSDEIFNSFKRMSVAAAAAITEVSTDAVTLSPVLSGIECSTPIPLPHASAFNEITATAPPSNSTLTASPSNIAPTSPETFKNYACIDHHHPILAALDDKSSLSPASSSPDSMVGGGADCSSLVFPMTTPQEVHDSDDEEGDASDTSNTLLAKLSDADISPLYRSPPQLFRSISSYLPARVPISVSLACILS